MFDDVDTRVEVNSTSSFSRFPSFPLSCLCTGHFRLELTITNCRAIKGCRRNVYRLAQKNHGFYTTSVNSDSIKYSGDDLVVSVAFMAHGNRIDFFGGLQFWNDQYPGMVGDPVMTSGWGFLGYDKAILCTHYIAEGSSSPEAPGSARSVETQTTVVLLADWDTKHYQNISPLKLVAGCGLQMCHIKDNRHCKNLESVDKNNFFAMSPSLHKQYDGHGPGSTPSVNITTLSTHNEQVEVETEDGGTEYRTRVELMVKFFSLEAFDGCDGVLKDGSYMLNKDDPTVWVTSVLVLHPESFNEYVEFKSEQTLKMWV